MLRRMHGCTRLSDPLSLTQFERVKEADGEERGCP